MKRILVISLFAILVLSLSIPCQALETTQEDTVQQFYQALEKGDLDTMFDLIPPEMVEQIGKSTPEEMETLGGNIGLMLAIAGGVKNGKFKVQFTNFQTQVQEQTETASTILASFHISLESGGEKNQSDFKDVLSLKKLENKWVIDNISSQE